jgi:hypothetical protein
MHTIETLDGRKKTNFPSSLEEMSREDYLYFITLLFKADNLLISYYDIKTIMLYRLMKLKHRKIVLEFLNNTRREKELDEIAANVFGLQHLVDFLFEEKTIVNDYGQSINQFSPAKSLRNFLPEYDGLHGPMDAFMDLVVVEYTHAITSFMAYSKTGDIAHLDELIAILYRPSRSFMYFKRRKPEFDGLRRVNFNENSYMHRIKQVAAWPFEVKYAVYLYFLACEEHMKTGEIEIAGTRIDLSVMYKDLGEEQTDSDGLGLTGIMFKVAETGVFGTMKETAHTNIYDFFLKLYQNRKEYMEYKSKQKKHDKH